MGPDTPLEITYDGHQYELSMQELWGRHTSADLCPTITLTMAPDIQYSKEELDEMFAKLGTNMWYYGPAECEPDTPKPKELDDIAVPQEVTDTLMETLLD